MKNFIQFTESNKTSKEFIEDAIISNSVSAEHEGQSPDRPLDGEDEILNKSHLLGFPENKE